MGTIYIIHHPLSNKIYIGQTINFDQRKRYHLSYTTKNPRVHKDYWLKSLLDKGLVPIFIRVAELPNEQLNNAERILISFCIKNNIPLTNGTDGGDSNYHMLEETKQKISDALKGKPMPENSKKVLYTKEVRDKILATKQSNGCFIKAWNPPKVKLGHPLNKGKRSLTLEQVKEIELKLKGDRTGVSLSKEYSVSTAAISAIKHGIYFNSAWGNIKSELSYKTERSRLIDGLINSLNKVLEKGLFLN